MLTPIARIDIMKSFAQFSKEDMPTPILPQNYIYGDFNARLIKALPAETSIVGPFVFGASTRNRFLE